MEFFAFDWITQPSVWLSLATLTALEIVLGIDNLVFVAILTERVAAERRALARKVGLALALGTRLVLLAMLAWIVKLTAPLFTVAGLALSWRDLILIAGGAFLLVKATHEIHNEVESEAADEKPALPAPRAPARAQLQVFVAPRLARMNFHSPSVTGVIERRLPRLSVTIRASSG